MRNRDRGWSFLLAVIVSAAWAGASDTGQKLSPLPRGPGAELFAGRPRAAESRAYHQVVLAEGLQGPDGLAVHPVDGRIFISEEDGDRILFLQAGAAIPVITRDTPITTLRKERRVSSEPLRQPEGLAFSAKGDLYVAEDYPGGRLLRFPARADGGYPEGEEVVFPGDWRGFAWEDVAVGSAGELLLAGSDIEATLNADSMKPFMGVLLFRDAQGAWWAPYRRPFASFSSVQFTRDDQQAVYTCEVSGEIGWLDLQGRRLIGGCSVTPVKSPEGIAVMPDGRLMVALEGGTLVCVDPAIDRHDVVAEGLGSLEVARWDPLTHSVLVTEQAGRRVLMLEPQPGFPADENRMDMAVYHPLFNPRHVPVHCPEYLARILTLAGLDYTRPDFEPISFQDFTARVPLIAADARAVCLNPEAAGEDPLERVQFVVFKPNQMMLGELGPYPALALFAARSRSGRITATSLMQANTMGFTFENPRPRPLGAASLAVPMPAGVGVSALGIANINFLGLGRTPDYSIVLNPTRPFESYLIVYQQGQERVHYRLEYSEADADRKAWVVAFTESRPEEWVALGRQESEQP